MDSNLINIREIHFSDMCRTKKSLYESIEYTVGIYVQFMPTHSVDGKSLNRKANLFGKLKGILFHFSFWHNVFQNAKILSETGG